ncbi:MAG TPA: hypothetical protein VN437_03825, partial [Rectinemataceae bacterium]|nr:hypothetical protein [Rectinemataceae bacterium]
EWDSWQETWLEKLLRTAFAANPDRPIFTDEAARLFKGKRMDTMRSMGFGSLALSSKSLVFKPSRGSDIVFNLDDIEGPGVLKWNFFEFYVGKTVYRIKFRSKSASGRKYAVALDLLTRMRGG